MIFFCFGKRKTDLQEKQLAYFIIVLYITIGLSPEVIGNYSKKLKTL